MDKKIKNSLKKDHSKANIQNHKRNKDEILFNCFD